MEKSGKKQIVIRIACLIASFCLWLYINNYENPIKTYKIKNVTVQVLNQDLLKQNNLVLSPNQNFNINLTIKGNAMDVYSVKASDFKLVADLSSYALKKGDNRIPVKIEKYPDNINVVQTDSLWVDINLDEYTQKTVPVTTNIQGRPQIGLYSSDATVNPRNVTVSGPAKNIQLVDHVEVNVNVSNLTSDAELKVVPQPVDAKGNLISDVKVQPGTINVSVPIRKAKSVAVNVKTKGQPSSKISIKSVYPEQNYVDVIGSESELADINSIDTEEVDLSSITGDTEVKAKLNVPKNVRLVGSSTVTIKITTEQAANNPTNTNTTLSVNIGSTNLDQSLKAEIKPSTITVVVSGGTNISSDSVKAVVDLSNLKEGTHDLPVNITLPEGVKKVSQTPDKVTVTISKK
ncbi:YbbR-like domain-containing protein [Clostridium neuense]|uniref:YbbR-like domain-containing protein n=1 Tax=Clostridium neuense TaxID=1728934 RepID=A0ABW8T9V1_9CLOT